MPCEASRSRPAAIIALVLVASCAARALAADRGPDADAELSALLEPIRAAHGVPALAGAIVTLEGADAVGACGVRQRGVDTPVTPDDLFHIGSCTKSMTASLMAILVEAGDLDWDTSPADAFEDLEVSIDPGWKKATLAQLVCNTGGAPHDLDRDGLWKRLWKQEGSPRDQREQLVEGVLVHPPVHEPGTEFLYSNAGFSIAGAMAERVTGTPFEELISVELFAPLGITSAGFGAPGSPTRLDQPRGHRADGSAAPAGSDNPPAISPAGRVHLSLADWARYVAWHLRAAREGDELLTDEAFARLHTPPPEAMEAYGYGWKSVERDWGGGSVLTHSGSNTMWYAVVWLAPRRDFAVISACNQGGESGAGACDRAAWALIQRHRQSRETPAAAGAGEDEDSGK